MVDHGYAVQDFTTTRSIQHDGVITLHNTTDTITIEIDQITERGAVLRFATRAYVGRRAEVSWRVVRPESPHTINRYPTRTAARSILANTVAIHRTKP